MEGAEVNSLRPQPIMPLIRVEKDFTFVEGGHISVPFRKGQVKDAVKAFEDTLKGGDAKKMDEALRACYKKLDQVAAKGTIHKNAAARGKARLAKARNKAAAKA